MFLGLKPQQADNSVNLFAKSIFRLSGWRYLCNLAACGTVAAKSRAFLALRRACRTPSVRVQIPDTALISKLGRLSDSSLTAALFFFEKYISQSLNR